MCNLNCSQNILIAWYFLEGKRTETNHYPTIIVIWKILTFLSHNQTWFLLSTQHHWSIDLDIKLSFYYLIKALRGKWYFDHIMWWIIKLGNNIIRIRSTNYGMEALTFDPIPNVYVSIEIWYQVKFNHTILLLVSILLGMMAWSLVLAKDF